MEGKPECFNPRTRRGCDLTPAPLKDFIYMVSIHAPAGGATGMDGNIHDISAVSIHAPAGGATWAK